jgi:hypothetical protein
LEVAKKAEDARTGKPIKHALSVLPAFDQAAIVEHP